MGFLSYDETTRDQFDSQTQRSLNELQTRFGNVEVKEVAEKEFCVRVLTEVGGYTVPMAAIGSTLHDAADRLIRIMSLPPL